MKITYYGHSCFAVQANGKDLLFDPYITPNELASHIKVDEIPADYIFISHAHFDHTTRPSIPVVFQMVLMVV